MKNLKIDKEIFIRCPICDKKSTFKILSKTECGVSSGYLKVRCPICGESFYMSIDGREAKIF